ncbi:hypothetical protein ZIOFF_062505 [Zingiber officinale]|uniref:Subtilisin-like protease fibronectin type-III domain-containing protein n=1 Tax=Zingiber officinale TaxID=94328 RepID=A0A8J5K9C0_ZINOF|nr:hypothetical protein ZIOFF_062505 [Zingiber officinale]
MRLPRNATLVSAQALDDCYPSDSLPMTIPDGSLDGPNCWQGLVEAEVKGKMVICSIESGSSILIGDNIKSLGGLAMLMVNGELDGYTTMAEAPNLPMSYLNYINGSSVAHYVNATQTPVASIIFKGTVFKVFPAPTVAYFSSRGPNSQSRAVLKPDILGPGVNILAAWPIQVDGLESVAVEVLPETLDFSGKINESKSFNISFSKKITHPPTQEEGHLLWISDTKSVRIPILILV